MIDPKSRRYKAHRTGKVPHILKVIVFLMIFLLQNHLAMACLKNL